VAVVFGALCWVLVSLFAHSVIGLAYWATGWGAGNARVLEVGGYVEGGAESSGMQWFGASLIAALNSLVYCVATGFAFAFFWCASTAIYLLLRYDVDQTEFDEVHMEDEEVRYGLPPLIKDEAGVPAVPPEAKSPAEPAAAADAPSNNSE
jgi:hypothetical protein